MRWVGNVTRMGEIFNYHAIKTYWGCGGIAPRILDLGIRQVSRQLHAPAALHQGNPPVPYCCKTIHTTYTYSHTRLRQRPL